MNTIKMCSLIITSILMVSVSAVAGNFDGSKELICSVMNITECQPGGNCQAVSADEVGIPHFLRISFKNKKISASYAEGYKKSTDIERFEKVDGKVIIQGAEDGVEGVRDGVGWSAAILEESGRMVLTASGDDVGFVIFGACMVP